LSDEIDPSGHSSEKERGAFRSDRSRALWIWKRTHSLCVEGLM